MDALVSVIIPTYNRLPLLKQTLDSVTQQTYKNIEIIVVDDGTMGNENEELCTQFSKVRYFKIENSGGPAKPRNVGAEHAKGHFLAFVDDDDLWVPEKLEKQVQLLLENPQFGLVHGPCKVMDVSGKVTREIIGRPGSPEVKHGDVSLRMIGNWTLMTSSVMIKRDVFNNVGGFNEEMPPAGEDTEFWVRCSFETLFFYYDEPLVLYRKHESTSVAFHSEYFDLTLYLKRTIKRALEKQLITLKQSKRLTNNLVKKQIKDIHRGRWKTFKRLFKLNPFWFFNFGILKLLVLKISRK